MIAPWYPGDRFPVASNGVPFSAKDAKADVKLGRNDGGTALMFAAQEGHLEVAKQLGLDQMDPRISLTL